MNQSKQSSQSHKTASFGFADVDAGDKQGLVHDVFRRVAANYDIMNDCMSFGVHREWKDRLIDLIRPASEMHLLDVAGGTGDIAFQFIKRGGGHVTAIDINEAMLREGKKRSVDNNLYKKVSWSVGNAEYLPVSSGAFDVYTIGFGIRNVTDINAALCEAYRVLRVGGRFFCLEFSMPETNIIKKLYDIYSFEVIPKMGGLIADDYDSYQYLVESIRRFPKKDEFSAMIRQAGFDKVTYKPLSSGVATIHIGWKL